MGASAFALPWAVHISDGVLTAPWMAGGFAIAGLLALLAMIRIRDEEVPRIALLSAAFFVSSLMHLPLGPTSVHLLLNGLVGVILGRRAPLAILLGLTLQAALFGHGGFSALGINACVLTLPALLVGGLFAPLLRLSWKGPRRQMILWLLGFLLGSISVLTTLLLQAAVLLWGSAEVGRPLVAIVFLSHLPIVGVEGVVLGFTVSFLARVKPEMIGIWDAELQKCQGTHCTGESRSLVVLLAALSFLISAGPVQAHRLDADFKVLADRRVRIESWFDLGGVPKGADVKVYGSGEKLLVEGRLDEDGFFVFPIAEVEPLKVIVWAGEGHRKEFVIPREALAGQSAQPREQGEAWRERLKDALLGVSFLLALAAFILSLRNGRKLRGLRELPVEDRNMPPSDPASS